MSRFPINSKLYDLPVAPPKGRRGRKPKKGELIGTPKTLLQLRENWEEHPTEKGCLVQAFTGIWHTVLPQVVIRVVVVRRDEPKAGAKRTPRRHLEAFFTTDLSLSLAQILSEYKSRWSIEIDIRDA